MAVAFDAVGTGNSGSVGTASWTHTASGANRCVIVAASWTTASSYNISGDTYTATYDGVAMTLLTTAWEGGSTHGNIALFYLLNPPTTTNATVTIAVSPTTNHRGVVGNSISYTGVSSVAAGTTANGSGTSGSVSVSSATADMAVAAFMQWLGTATVPVISTANGTTTRASGAGTGTSSRTMYAAADQPGSATATFNATFPSSDAWAGVVANLHLSGPNGDVALTATATVTADGVVTRPIASSGTTATATPTAVASNNRKIDANLDVTVGNLSAAVANEIGGAARPVTATPTAAALRTTNGGAQTLAVSASTSASIANNFTGSASLAVIATPTAGADGARATTTVTATPTGTVAFTGAAQATVTASATVTSAAKSARVAAANRPTTVTLTADAVKGSGQIATTPVTATPTAAAQRNQFATTTTTPVTATPSASAGFLAQSGTALPVTAAVTAAVTLTPSPGAAFNLTNYDPFESFIIADQLAADRVAQDYLASPKFEIVMYDNAYGSLGTVNDYISATATFVRNNVPTATVVLKGDDPFVAYAERCDKTVVPITILVNGMRWSGRVDVVEDDIEEGVNTVTLQCVGDWNWLNKILVWPNFLLPLQVQFPKEAVYLGPAVSVIETMLAEQLIRLQSGIWELVNNILNPPAWFGTMMEKHGLTTPCCVIPNKDSLLEELLLDTSKWVAVSGRMDTVATLVEQICKDNGINIEAFLWLPGEPQPTTMFTLKEPTICFRVRDKSGVTGPTGTIIDGLIKDVVDLANGALGDILGSMGGSGVALPPGVSIAPAFGVDFTPPWPIYNCDHPRSGIKSCKTSFHHPLARTVLGGGKSPDWVNKLIDTILELALSEALTALGASGISSTLLDGIFDNVILAFQQVTNQKRRTELGRYGYPEFFTSTGSTAYTLDEFFALEIAMWDTRGYVSGQIVAYDGTPYTLGKDYQIGDLVSWIRRNKLYTDYVDEATVVDDRSNRVQVLTTIGDGSAQEAPATKLQRRIADFETSVQIMMLSSN